MLARQMGLASANTQEQTVTVPPASAPLLQQTEQAEDLDTAPKQAVTSTSGTSAPAPSSPYQPTQSSHTQTPPGLVEIGATSDPTPASTAHLQSTESPKLQNPALSPKPSPAVVPQPVPTLNFVPNHIQSINAAAVASAPTPAEPFSPHSHSSEPARPAALSFRPATKKPTVSTPLPGSNKPVIMKPKKSETSATTEAPNKSSQPPITNTPVNPPSTSFTQFQPPITNPPLFSTKPFTFLSKSSSSSTSKPTNPPTSSLFTTPPSSTSTPQSTRLFENSSPFTHSDFKYTPPIFGIPSAIPSRHSNVKSPFTAGVSWSSGQTFQSPFSFRIISNTGDNIPRTNVSNADGNPFFDKEITEGCKQQ